MAYTLETFIGVDTGYVFMNGTLIYTGTINEAENVYSLISKSSR